MADERTTPAAGDLADQLERASRLLTQAQRDLGWVERDAARIRRVLRWLADACDQVELATETAVQVARQEDRTWDAIGRGLGVSRQAAWRRFAGEEGARQ